jgi:signal transduction histidine kinase
MSPQPLAAAVAWFALGASFLGTVLLLLFNPRSPGIRWYALFWAAIMTWLAAQGWAFAVGDWSTARRVLSVAIHLAPGLFLAFALVEGMRKPLPYPLGAVALALALLPLQIRTWDDPFSVPLLIAWNAGAWIVATLLFVRHGYARVWERPASRRLGVLVVAGMVAVLPIGLLGGYVTGREMSVYVLPLLMVWIHFLTFVGVVRLRFYDIEVRAARTGELAAGAAEAERLAVVGELAASLAHEIRNPLTGVRSLAQRLAEEQIDEPRRRRYAGVILDEVGRVERLVTNLLGIARQAPRGPRADSRTVMAPLFDDLLLLVGSRAEKGGIRLVADAGGVEAAAAREALAQALLNLLLNAIGHTPAGGSVHLLARRVGDTVELRVRDSGPGVRPEERERIWEPFHSGSGGTGLGLAVVRRLAREHGWGTEVGEAPGGGAEFRLRVPGPPSPDSPPPARRTRASQSAERGERAAPDEGGSTRAPLARP